jgi:mono/diheme cytochrome c family protein
MRITLFLFFPIAPAIIIPMFWKSGDIKNQDEIIVGKKIYEKNCKKCHSLFEEVVATPMYGTLERIPDRDWLYKFIKNPTPMYAEDAYSICLKKEYGTEMPGYPSLTDKEIDAVYKYVYAEAEKNKDMWNNKKFFVPCK